ncbi:MULTISPECIES: hypothetical protein [unclassified Agrococcus]|uniref:hypothetical protein n=1 Tax=unclassified Agrococcus TaxID=2615065 RepID=UPI0036132BED
MSVTAWDPGAGAALAAMLDALDLDLERTQGILRRRGSPVMGAGVPYSSEAVLHALALADDAEAGCAAARRRLADTRVAAGAAFWAHDAAEAATALAVQAVGGAVAAGLGTVVLGGLLATLASLPVAAPACLLAAGLAQTPIPGLLLDVAGRVLAPLAPSLPELLNDPAFVDALALAVQSADEALAGLAGLGIANPLLPFLAQGRPDDAGLSSAAGVALAVALAVTGNGMRLPGAAVTRAEPQPAPPPPQPPIASYAAAFERLSADGPSIEVQRYALPDGTVVWQVLARGTASFAIDDPSTAYDLTANIENAANAQGRPLVGSAAAVEQALAAAGARPGDVVQMFGYSQGGAAVAAAAGGAYAVDAVVTFGAPVGATPVPPGTTAVAVQHDSDLVASLGGVHGDDRLVLEASPDLARIETDRYDPAGQPLSTVPVGGHHPEAYAATAAELDALDDDLVQGVWGEVGAATAGATASGAVGFDVVRDAP